MVQSLFIFLVLTILYQISLGTECFHARAALPVSFHCQDLIEAIAYLSRIPGENDVRSWGRRLPTELHTMKVPKSYWIAGRGPSTCAVHVDVNPANLFAVDSFRQSDVGQSAARVVENCLIRQRLIGLDYPTELKHVYVKVVRSDSPLTLGISGTHHVESILLPDTAGVLHIATGDVVISSGGRTTSNSSANLILEQ